MIIFRKKKVKKLFQGHSHHIMETSEETDSCPRLRPMFCSLGEVTRSDGSVVWCQGDTAVACSVFGPGEAKPRLTEKVVDR